MAPEGGESPPPSRQTGKQLHETPGSGTSKPKGEAKDEWKEQPGNKGTEGLTSNPRGVLEDEVERKFAKTAK
ncbi:uncharacterized protein SPSK_02866 [Sporothrix schenckii 1099-18]|uniref:Uncharacterized protein n=2 Tax=Sporothrix schenckii TaxID=29908 RepID=U7PNG3_SPOS1|nr:uncharacterized protein SPSK_02866 [Sporothrix schenckii 1099-18]ERS97127.1 hypothetical protein HMPREF1624_06457 [Sporothrix schenckii ATCC 58251]KJR86338.1 hypothetical protein SPSK_02866 [Sporothrix schenckii 1099-18]